MDSNQTNNRAANNKSPDYLKLIDKVFACVNDHMMILFNQMLSSADDKLFDLSEKCTSNKDQMKYIDCTRIFRTEKNDISGHFFVNLNNSLMSTTGNELVPEDQELSLVNQEEMEEMVAITTMHAKAMNLYGLEVNHLETRLEYLEIMCEDIFDKEALDPKHLCQIFQRTIENLEIDIDIKLIFYKLFDEEVCSKLGIMYKSINQIFIDNDILPEIIMKTTKQEEVEHLEEEVSTQVASYYEPTENKAIDFMPRTKADISRIVNDFMNGEMTITGDEIDLPESFLRVPTQQDLDGKDAYVKKEVLKALSKLQHRLTSSADKNVCLTTDQIKQEMLSDISKEHGGIIDKQVNILDERNMDFVGMMFGAIVDDETVSEIMSNLIYQLQIPVMKVAMSDDTLFEDEEHPARVTVDLLTEAGKGINLKDDHLYSELESIVDNILDEFEIDIDAFETAVDTLQDIIFKEEEIASETERKQQRQILQQHARTIVLTQLKMVSCDKKIPNNVRPLILKHWSTLMLNRYLRHGRNSEQWVQSVLLLKLLLKCMQPIQYKSQFKMIKDNHVALLEAVNDELYQTQQNQGDITDQITQLKSHFLQMIDDYDLQISDEKSTPVSEEDILEDVTDSSEDELRHIQEQVEIAKQKIAQLQSSAKPGAWYEIYNGEDKAVRRLKLSVILTDAAQLIFVDRKGIKVIEKDAEVFAKELEENRSRMLADHSTFDNALGAVISALAA